MKNKIIFVACDTSNLDQIKKILKNIKTKKLKIIPKFGLQFFYSKNGRKFLEKYKKGDFSEEEKPFALWISFPDPHEPYEAPKRYTDMFPPEEIKLPPQTNPKVKQNSL